MRPLSQFQPALAAFLATCVWLLCLAGASPALHRSVCAHHAGHHDHAHHAGHDSKTASGETDSSLPADHACAITLFAAGCVSPPAPVLFAEPALNAHRIAHFIELKLARTLRGPARVCGPPLRAS